MKKYLKIMTKAEEATSREQARVVLKELKRLNKKRKKREKKKKRNSLTG